MRIYIYMYENIYVLCMWKILIRAVLDGGC